MLVRKSVYLFGVLMTHFNQKYIKSPSREYSHLLKFSVLIKRVFSTFLASSFSFVWRELFPLFLIDFGNTTYRYLQLVIHITSRHNLQTLFHNHTNLYFQTPKLQIMVNVVLPDAVASPEGDQPVPPVASIHPVPPSQQDKKYYPDMDMFMKVSILVYFSQRLI